MLYEKEGPNNDPCGTTWSSHFYGVIYKYLHSLYSAWPYGMDYKRFLFLMGSAIKENLEFCILRVSLNALWTSNDPQGTPWSSIKIVFFCGKPNHCRWPETFLLLVLTFHRNTMKEDAFEFHILRKVSFLWFMKNKGPNILPWGTPWPSIRTFIFKQSLWPEDILILLVFRIWEKCDERELYIRNEC